MKTKLFAVLLAITLMITTFSLSGCSFSLFYSFLNNTESSTTVETSETDALSSDEAKELFSKTVSSILPEGFWGENGTVAELLSSLSANSADEDNVTAIEGSFTKLNYNGIELASEQPLDIKLKSSSDFDSESLSICAEATILGETLTFETVKNGYDVYVTDLFGINSLPISADELNISIIRDENGTATLKLLELLLKSAPEVISANITEDSFSSERKTVSIDGEEYSDADVITLSFPDGTVRRIAYEMIDEIEKDQQLAQEIGLSDREQSIIEQAENYHEIRVINTVVGGECKRLVLEAARVVKDDNDTEFIITSMIILDVYENGFKLQSGVLGANREISKGHGITTIEYSLDNGNEKCTLTKYEYYENTKLFELNGKADGNKRSGQLTYKDGLGYTTFDYVIELNENSGRVALTNFVEKGSDTPSEHRYGIVLDYTADESELNAKIVLDINAENESDDILAVGTFDVSIRYKDVIIPNQSKKTEQFDERYFETTFSLKYPNLIGLIQELFGFGDNDHSQISINLPANFRVYPRYDDDDTNYVNYVSENAWIYVMRYDQEEFTDFDAYMLKHFAENVRDNVTGNKKSVPVTEIDGIYHFPVTYDGAVYDFYFFKGDDEFWEIQFVCMSKDYGEFKSKFEKWAKTVDPTGQTEYKNPLDDIIGGAIG